MNKAKEEKAKADMIKVASWNACSCERSEKHDCAQSYTGTLGWEARTSAEALMLAETHMIALAKSIEEGEDEISRLESEVEEHEAKIEKLEGDVYDAKEEIKRLKALLKEKKTEILETAV